MIVTALITLFAALPSTGYQLLTVTNPSSALTDFTLLVDLSNMDASWWSEVDTSDGTKGRAAIHSGETELACDWIDFDDTGETGFLRVLWDGSLATSGTQQLRVYPPVSANDSVAANDTYGSDNAYDSSWEGYWPDGGGTDRTSNGNDGTGYNSVSLGGTTGKVGTATDFENSSSHYVRAGSTGLSASAGTISVWFTSESSSDTDYMFAHYNSGNRCYLHTTNARIWGGLGSDFITISGPLVTTNGTTWYQAVMTWNGTNSTLYVGGSSYVGPTSYSSFSSIGSTVSFGAVWTGRASGYYDGLLDEIQMHSAARSAAWIALEYAQTNNNSSFYTASSWVAGGSAVPIFLNHYMRRR